MHVASKIIVAFAKTLDLVLRLYIWVIIIGAIISWVNPSPYHPVVRTINRLTEPVLGPIRRIIPPLGGIDFSPVVAIFGIYLVQSLVVPLLYRLAFLVM
ncbi:MAG: YggT family protein [Aquificota bacterium]|nr:MAG: YggT family protein [Aquificota bacterium]